ncbi:putative transcription factor SPT20 homolog-like 2 [Lepus europaeus]|uniref:putative transcription factor SPT20 homolog-like 2 n=1 Tax=Lepus europaeus TaxID=9983 RepID=UPI002B45FAC1|nr:putative transcription factor SPT20 homolog-like 2 [Lepus europaeus]
MQHSLEHALGSAEAVIQSAQRRPPKRRRSSSGDGCLHQKLYDIYVQECEKEPEFAELRSSVHLLDKLVGKEALPRLVVNLYPGSEGYSLMLRDAETPSPESIRLPYDQREFLEFLDAEELPPVLVDSLERARANVFHRGCVLAEVRDYRQCSKAGPPAYHIKHVLLRPTIQTLLCDVQSVSSGHEEWTQEDKLTLESQLILATAEPLCLEPSVAVACATNRLLYNRQKMNTSPMRRCFRRCSESSLAQQQQQQQLAPRPPVPEPRGSPGSGSREAGGAAPHSPDLRAPQAEGDLGAWKQAPGDLAVPSDVDVQKCARGEGSFSSDDSPRTIWPAPEEDDCELAGEAGPGSWATKLSVMQSLNDPVFCDTAPQCKRAGCGDGLCPPLLPADPRAQGVLHGVRWMPGWRRSAAGPGPQESRLCRPAACCPSGSAAVSSPCSGKPLEEGMAGCAGRGSPRGQGVKRGAGQRRVRRKLSAGPRRPVSTLLPAGPTPAKSSQRPPATQVLARSSGGNVVNVGAVAPGVPAVVSDSVPAAGRLGAARASTAISGLTPSAGQLPSALPEATEPCPQAQVSLQLVLNSPATVLQLQLPCGSFILNLQQQPQQPQRPRRPRQPQRLQQPPPPQLCQVAVQQLQPPRASQPPQPVPQGSGPGAGQQVWALEAQQALLISIGQARGDVPPQTTVAGQLGPAQGRAGQSLPQQQSRLPSTLQPPGFQLRQQRRPVAPATAQEAQPCPQVRSTHQSKGKARRNSTAPPPS